MPSTTAKWISFSNHRNRKVVGGKRNVLVHYVDVCAPDLSGVVFCNPFKWDILLFILIENHVFCVPSTTGKWISFHKHMNRKVVGGKHNVLLHYVDSNAPNPTGIVLCNPLIWDMILLFILIKNLVIFLQQQQNEFYSAAKGTKKLWEANTMV